MIAQVICAAVAGVTLALAAIFTLEDRIDHGRFVFNPNIAALAACSLVLLAAAMFA